MNVTIKLSRIERLLNAVTYVSRSAVRGDDTSDPYLVKIKEILAEERAEGFQEGYQKGHQQGEIDEQDDRDEWRPR